MTYYNYRQSRYYKKIQNQKKRLYNCLVINIIILDHKYMTNLSKSTALNIGKNCVIVGIV
jgi:hypothetical protein